MIAVIQEAWIGGVSTRRVDDLVQAISLSGISKSQVSKLRKDIDERVNAFLDRPLAGEWPYVSLDATYLKSAKAAGWSRSRRIAVAANTEGKREIVGWSATVSGPRRTEASFFRAKILRAIVLSTTSSWSLKSKGNRSVSCHIPRLFACSTPT